MGRLFTCIYYNMTVQLDFEFYGFLRRPIRKIFRCIACKQQIPTATALPTASALPIATLYVDKKMDT